MNKKLLISLNMIGKYHPPPIFYRKLIKRIAEPMGKMFPIIEIMQRSDVQDAIWCLRCFDYPDYCLFSSELLGKKAPEVAAYEKCEISGEQLKSRINKHKKEIRSLKAEAEKQEKIAVLNPSKLTFKRYEKYVSADELYKKKKKIVDVFVDAEQIDLISYRIDLVVLRILFRRYFA